jgi:hypothetical protein
MQTSSGAPWFGRVKMAFNGFVFHLMVEWRGAESTMRWFLVPVVDLAPYLDWLQSLLARERP